MDDLMQEAWSLTNGDRRDAYGDPREVFAAYGDVWSAILRMKLKPGERVTASDVTLMMTGLKICRESVNKKRDNVVDAHGYLSLHTRVLEPPRSSESDEVADLLLTCMDCNCEPSSLGHAPSCATVLVPKAIALLRKA